MLPVMTYVRLGVILAPGPSGFEIIKMCPFFCSQPRHDRGALTVGIPNPHGCA